jgi:hypothetical protein
MQQLVERADQEGASDIVLCAYGEDAQEFAGVSTEALAEPIPVSAPCLSPKSVDGCAGHRASFYHSFAFTACSLGKLYCGV